MEDEKKKIPSPEEIEQKNKYQLSLFQKHPDYHYYWHEVTWRVKNGFMPPTAEPMSLSEWIANPRLAKDLPNLDTVGKYPRTEV